MQDRSIQSTPQRLGTGSKRFRSAFWVVALGRITVLPVASQATHTLLSFVHTSLVLGRISAGKGNTLVASG